MDAKRIICVIDSGIGGLPYLEWMRSELPCEQFVYLSDVAGFPYGEQTPEELCRRLELIMSWFVRRYNPQACVVACNTASVVGLAFLRQTFPDIAFVGVVPAVKPAAETSRKRAIGILATQRTVDDRYLAGLVQKYAAEVKVESLAAGSLVRFIEHQLYVPADPVPHLRPIAKRFAAAGVDSVVLGCTHFLHIADQLSHLLGPEIAIIDSREGVTRQLKRIIAYGALSVYPCAMRDRQNDVPWYITANVSASLLQHVSARFQVQPQLVRV